MKTGGQTFLDQLANFPRRTFENGFSSISVRLGLGADLNREELQLLYDASYQAALCNISINGLGGCGGRIKPESERNRTKLECDFLSMRNSLYSTTGWWTLSASKRGSIRRIFLTVFVTEDNLAR